MNRAPRIGTMKETTYGKQWKQSFFHVSDYGRSSFRLLLIGLGFILIWWGAAAAKVPFSAFRTIRAFGVLGIIFVVLSVTGPSLEVVIRVMGDKTR
jgi:hypothetical protein